MKGSVRCLTTSRVASTRLGLWRCDRGCLIDLGERSHLGLWKCDRGCLIDLGERSLFILYLV
ncbi:hypothetical protein [Nostoc sp.]|uniref:hypothetical protein n=1 Tax=Nostoc sp. TaxID=1180 RepID=UPI002FFB3D87